VARRQPEADVGELTLTRYRSMTRAVLALVDQTCAWAERGESVLHQLMAGRQPAPWKHYPDGDARDPEAGYRWYYHCHDQPDRHGEHGHFHLFAEKPMGYQRRPLLTHLIAIGIDDLGQPVRLFTVNRWVTDEAWRDADRVLRLLARFRMDGAGSQLEISLWLKALTVLFQAQIQALVLGRDAEMTRRFDEGRRPNLLEDRRVEVITSQPISLTTQVEALRRIRSPRRKTPAAVPTSGQPARFHESVP